MKIGVSSTCLWNLKPEDAIVFAVNEELYSIEFWVDHLQLYETSLKKLHTLLEKEGIIPTVHSVSWDINLCSFSKDVRNFSIREIIRSINIACEIGAEIIVVHPGRMSFERAGRELSFDILIESFKKLYDYSNQKGLKLCVENMEPLEKELLVTCEDFLEFYSKLGEREIFITIDLAHLGSFIKIKDFFNRLSNKIIHLHISDLKHEQIHLPLGEGELPIKKILNFLSGKYEGIYNLEFYSNDRKAKKVIESIRYIRNLALSLGG